MKKITLIFGSAFLALTLATAPLLAQTDPGTPADTQTTDQGVRANIYRGIIPAAQNADGSIKSNVNIDCGEVNGASSLGEKIHCGKVTLNDFPSLIVYLIQWILTLAGGIAVIMIMIGGFQYMLGGVTDDKERGKKTLIYALGGLVVAFMAWWIVELVQVWITS